ncbi:unnamed protein product, partial [Symbiodinium sp. CCMP2456]
PRCKLQFHGLGPCDVGAPAVDPRCGWWQIVIPIQIMPWSVLYRDYGKVEKNYFTYTWTCSRRGREIFSSLVK